MIFLVVMGDHHHTSHHASYAFFEDLLFSLHLQVIPQLLLQDFQLVEVGFLVL